MKYEDLPFVEELMFELNDLDRVLHGEESSSEEEVDLRERRNEVIHRMQIGMIFSIFSTTNKFIRFLGLTNLQYFI